MDLSNGKWVCFKPTVEVRISAISAVPKHSKELLYGLHIFENWDTDFYQ